jgi:hypothetical protein
VLVEIWNYHYRPQELANYRKWAHVHALPYLRQQFDLVGFWIDNGEAPEVLGEPLDQLGPANITWIIQWQDMGERNQRMQAIFTSLEWQKIFEKLPGGFENYLRREARFTEAL